MFAKLRNGIADRVTLGRLRLFVNTLISKPWVKRDESLFYELMSHIDMAKVAPTIEEQDVKLNMLGVKV